MLYLWYTLGNKPQPLKFKKMIFVKELNPEQENQNVIYAINQDFQIMDLSECYDRFGQGIGAYNAGDYSIHNSASDAKKDCIDAIKEKFEFVNKHDPIDIYIDGGGGAIGTETDYLGQYEKIEICEFIEKWENDNATSEQVKALTYWDGNNFQSVIISAENQDESCSHEQIEDKEEIEKLNDLIFNAKELKTSNGCTFYQSDNFLVISTQFSTFFQYKVVEIDSTHALVLIDNNNIEINQYK